MPLCSPSILGQDPPLRKPEDLINHQLIHFAPTGGRINTRWADWLELNEIDNVDPNRGMLLSNGMAALNAAIAGQGVVLAPKTLASDDLERGTLVVPFYIELPTDFAWYVIAPSENMARPEIRAFKEWLISEAKMGHKR